MYTQTVIHQQFYEVSLSTSGNILNTVLLYYKQLNLASIPVNNCECSAYILFTELI